MNQRFGVDESTTGGVDNPRNVHGIARHSARRFQIFQCGKGFTKISWNIDVDLRFDLDPLRFSKHFRPSYLWTL